MPNQTSYVATGVHLLEWTPFDAEPGVCDPDKEDLDDYGDASTDFEMSRRRWSCDACTWHEEERWVLDNWNGPAPEPRNSTDG